MANILLGLFLLLFIIEEEAWVMLGKMVVPYFTLKVIRRPMLVMAGYSVSFLLYIYVNRLFFQGSIWKVDISVFVMLLVTKLTYYAKWLEQDNNHTKQDFLQYLGYLMFFPGMLAGPTFNYPIYL